MLFLNNKKLNVETFGDNSLKFDALQLNIENPVIKWCYDNDGELFTLQSIVDFLREQSHSNIELVLPYIPNARQDRRTSNKLFTLKTFSKILNNMHFSKVSCLEAHSDVSTALIDNFVSLPELDNDIDFLKYDAVCFPDAGAAKRYYSLEYSNVIVAEKHRDSNGVIVDYKINKIPVNTRTVIIRDDICGTGGTFTYAAKMLKEQGVEKIDLLVAHCENNVLKGELFNYIDTLYTTDSVFTAKKHEKIVFLREYRKEIK